MSFDEVPSPSHPSNPASLSSPRPSEGDTNLSPQRRAWAQRNIDAATQDLLDGDARYFLHQSVSTPCLSAICKADGIWLEDTAGRRYMDFHGNGVHHIGYGHPRLKRAIVRQLDDLPFVPRRFTCDVAPFACYRCPYGYPDIDGRPQLTLCRLACASYLRYTLEREGDVAAVVAEPARAVPYFPPPGFWQSVREACDEHGALLIFDEIPTGLGKTGRMFSCEHDGVVPDILVTGKSLGGGILPIAAAVCRADLDVAGAWAFGHYTHEKNPVTCRAALTTIEIIEEEKLVENARSVGALAMQRLQEMKARYDIIGDVRGRGLLLGVELVSERISKKPDEASAEAVMYHALDRGLSFKISMGNVLTLSPPLTITADQMNEALDILEQSILAAQGHR